MKKLPKSFQIIAIFYEMERERNTNMQCDNEIDEDNNVTVDRNE